MAVRLRRPGAAQLEQLLAGSRTDSFTYRPAGVSLDERIETSLHRARWETAVPTSQGFEHGSAALREWAVHRGAGLSLLADGPLAPGTNVAMVAPLPVGFVEVTCRVVDVIDESDLFGFAYGTLSIHPERGEESFMVRRAPDGTVRFIVQAASEPAHPVARFVRLVANRLQDRACNRYLEAMNRVVSSR
jgi:uncharacterized protein (UPF0548 family)